MPPDENGGDHVEVESLEKVGDRLSKLSRRKDPGDAATKAEQGHAQKRRLTHAQPGGRRSDAVRARQQQ